MSIGGSSGQSVELTVSPEASSENCLRQGACYSLFQDEGGYWELGEGRPARLWIVDVDGETVLIATDAPEAAYASWIDVVEEALSTLEWTS